MSVPGRPLLGAGLVETVAADYGIESWTEPLDLGGSSSLNLAIGNVVVRVHRTTRSVDRLEAMQAVRVGLRSAGLPFIAPISTRDGRRWTRWRGHLVEVEPRVSGEDMNCWEQLLVGMRLLGTVHQVLASLDVPDAARDAPECNQISVEDAQLCARQACAVVGAWPDLTADEMRFVEMSEAHARALAPLWSDYRGRLPRQLVHGDFWHNNVLFDGERVVAVLDLDFMTERDRIDDLALILYYTNSGDTLPPDLTIEQRRARLGELVDAYDEAAAPRLSSLERAALPLALARMMLKYTRYLINAATPEEQRAVLNAERPELDWSAAVLDDLADWQTAFT